MFLHRLVRALENEKIRYALVGGYAVALHGAVRGTVDIDLVIRLQRSDYLALEKLLQELGLEARLPVSAGQVFDFRQEYIEKRNLIAWNFVNPRNPVESVDVLLTEDLTRMKVDKVFLGSLTLHIASIDELIRMKLAAGRPQDLADVEALKILKDRPRDRRKISGKK